MCLKNVLGFVYFQAQKTNVFPISDTKESGKNEKLMEKTCYAKNQGKYTSPEGLNQFLDRYFPIFQVTKEAPDKVYYWKGPEKNQVKVIVYTSTETEELQTNCKKFAVSK